MDNRPFYAALAHANEMYGTLLEDNEFENIGLHAWDQIGNKQFKIYVYETEIKDDEVELPCNVDIVEAVMLRGVEYRSKDNVDWDNYSNGIVQAYINTRMRSHNLYDEVGKLIPYNQFGNTLQFKNYDGHCVKIIYKGVYADEQGLPYLNFKEVDAIAKYCAYISMQKKAFMTKDQSTFQMSQLLKQQWQFAVEDARTPIYLNQNDMDQILNVSSSWDRKRFGLSYKPLR